MRFKTTVAIAIWVTAATLTSSLITQWVNYQVFTETYNITMLELSEKKQECLDFHVSDECVIVFEPVRDADI